MRTKNQGFTLIELAVVLAIVGLLALGAVSGLSSLRENAKFQEDKQQLQDIKNTLLAFVAINNYLPCPARPQDLGKEYRDAASFKCKTLVGELPYATLETYSANPFTNTYSYHINRKALGNATNLRFESSSYFASGKCFADLNSSFDTLNGTNPPCFQQKTHPVIIQSTKDSANHFKKGQGNLTIKDSAGKVLQDNLPALIISHGKNSCSDNLKLGQFEALNCSQDASNTIFYKTEQSLEEAKHFDDLLLGITSLDIKQAAGVLYAH